MRDYGFSVNFTSASELMAILGTNDTIYVGCDEEGYDGNDLIVIIPDPRRRAYLAVFESGRSVPDYFIRASESGAMRVNRSWRQYARECV